MKKMRFVILFLMVLAILTMPACKKQKCPAYMTKEEVSEMHKLLMKEKIKPVKRDKKGLVKKKNPRL